MDHHYACSLAVPVGRLSHNLICLFLRSFRWRILLNTDAHSDVATVFEATMAGYLGNSFLPARAGEVRSYIINSRSSLTKTYVFTTALSGRMMDAIVLVLASSMVLLGVNPKPSWLGDMSRTTAVNRLCRLADNRHSAPHRAPGGVCFAASRCPGDCALA